MAERGSIAGRWHLVSAATPDGHLPAHRLDLIFYDEGDDLRGAVLLRTGAEVPLQALSVTETELRLQMSPLEDASGERPFLVMSPVGDRFEGAWDMAGAADIRLKLVRAADPAPDSAPGGDTLPRDVPAIPTAVAPLLSVRGGALAVAFYKAAFGADEVYRVEDPGGDVVSRLSIAGAEFWVSDESPAHGNFSPDSLGGGTVRMILTVSDPDGVYARALAAGARQIVPMENTYGWRVGRVMDPFGHHWEIGRPLDSSGLT